MSDGLHQRVRPTTLDGVIGQPGAVKTIKGLKRIPNAILFHGGSGTGKTTLARVVSRMLGCPPEPNNMDYQEINCAAVESPLETAKDIARSMSSSPLGKCRVWVLDEIQSFSRSRGGQESMLKPLEDGPDHAYFFLCTTDPKKLIAPIRNRCTQVELKPVSDAELIKLVNTVAAGEDADPPIDTKLVAKIVDTARGSPRCALVELEKVLGIPNVADRMAAVGAVGLDTAAFDLVKVLSPYKGSSTWKEVAAVLTKLQEGNEDPEGLRQMVLAVAKGSLLKCDGRELISYKIIRCLDTPLYDKNSGWAILVAGCFQVINGK